MKTKIKIQTNRQNINQDKAMNGQKKFIGKEQFRDKNIKLLGRGKSLRALAFIGKNRGLISSPTRKIMINRIFIGNFSRSETIKFESFHFIETKNIQKYTLDPVNKENVCDIHAKGKRTYQWNEMTNKNKENIEKQKS